MKLTVERIPESQVLLDITADDDEFNSAMETAYRTVGRQVQLPGFRKGKVPRGMIEKMMGREVFLEEANKHLMDDLYRRAVEGQDFVPVGDPNVEMVAIEPLSFKVTLPVFPAVEVGPYADVRVEPKDATVEEGEIEEVLTRLQKSQSPWADPAEPRLPQEGDQVTVDLQVREGEDEFQEPMTGGVFILGESNLFEGLTAQLHQMNVGETRTFDLTFTDEDETVNERLRGKTLTYTVSLTGLKERQLLPLDDDFAQTVGDAQTLDELRTEIRDDLHQGKTNESRAEVLNAIVAKMAVTATLELPSIMVDEAVGDELNQLRGRLAQQRGTLEEYLRLQGQTEAELRDELRPAAADRLRNSLLLREIAQLEGVEVSDADVEAEVESMIASSKSDDKDRLRTFYTSEYFQKILRNDLFERRVTDRLIEIGTEGRGAVINGYIAPPPSEDDEAEAEDASATAAAAAASADTDPTEPIDVVGTDVEPAAPAGAPVSAVEGGDAMSETDAPASGGVAGDGGSECPEGFPIKGNADSLIYHLPGHGSYERTIPEMCFATEADAEAAGYRPVRGIAVDDAGELSEG